MEQKTLDIIYICKGNTKYYDASRNKQTDIVEGVRCYLVDNYEFDRDFYVSDIMDKILFGVMLDYIDTCDSPKDFIHRFRSTYSKLKCSLAERICYLLRDEYVCDTHGHIRYINGFDDRLFNLDNDSRACAVDDDNDDFESALDDVLVSTTPT